MKGSKLAEILLQHPDYEVMVVYPQQEPTDDHQCEEPEVSISLADRIYIGPAWVGEYFLAEDRKWMEEETRPRRKEIRRVQVWIDKEVEV